MLNIENVIDNIASNVVIYRYEDNDFRIVYFNKYALKTEKLKLEDIQGKKLTEIFPAVKEFGLYDVLLEVQRTSKEQELSLNYYHDDRICGWRKNTVNKCDNGYLIVTYSDETASMNLENKLESLSLIVENSMNEVYIFDSKTYKISYMNIAAKKNIGYTFEEIKELSPYDIKPEYNKKQFISLMESLDEKEFGHLEFETLHQRKDGSLYNVEIKIHKMLIDKEEVFIAIVQDITLRKQEEQQLLESEEKFKTIVESSLISVMMYREKIIYANDAHCVLTGYSREEIFNMYPWEFFTPELSEKLQRVAKERFNGERETIDYKVLPVLKKNKEEVFVRALSRVVMFEGKKTSLVVSINITDEVKSNKQIELLSQALEQTDELVSIVDINGVMKYVNEALAVQTGYRKSELIGEHIKIFKSGKNPHKKYTELWDTILSGHVYRTILINIKKDKKEFYEEMTITPMHDEEGNINNFVVTGQDVTKRIELEEKLNNLATKDTLTGIYNRHKINEEIDIHIADYVRHFRAFSLLMIDIDHFKQINDNYGHDVGDSVLREITSIISNSIRLNDCFGRWGGEEFVVLLAEEDKHQAIQLATKLKEVVYRHSFETVGDVTVSIGVSVFQENDSKQKLIKRADDNLYKAKNLGRNRVCCE